MRDTSNNHYKKSLPFADTQIHSNKFSEGDTNYDDQTVKHKRINHTTDVVPSSSSSANQIDKILDLVEDIPSPKDISTTNITSSTCLTIAERIAQFQNPPELLSKPTIPLPHKPIRTRIKPIPDSTSESAESFIVSSHGNSDSLSRKQTPQTETISSINIPRFVGDLKHIRDNRFDSITSIDHVKDDVIAIELMEQQQQQPNQLIDTHVQNKPQLSWIDRLGESIRLLPANILAIVFIGLIGGLFISFIFVIIIA